MFKRRYDGHDSEKGMASNSECNKWQEIKEETIFRRFSCCLSCFKLIPNQPLVSHGTEQYYQVHTRPADK